MSENRQSVVKIRRAYHFVFTDEELDFIINYDIKYRRGQDGV